MCFQIDGKPAQADRYVKSTIITKVVYCVIYIDVFEGKCVVLKAVLRLPRLKYHIKTIGIDQSLRNSAIYKTYVFKTSRNYTNMLGSVTTSKNSNIFLRRIFLLLKYALMTVPDLP